MGHICIYQKSKSFECVHRFACVEENLHHDLPSEWSYLDSCFDEWKVYAIIKRWQYEILKASKWQINWTAKSSYNHNLHTTLTYIISMVIKHQNIKKEMLTEPQSSAIIERSYSLLIRVHYLKSYLNPSSCSDKWKVRWTGHTN